MRWLFAQARAGAGGWTEGTRRDEDKGNTMSWVKKPKAPVLTVPTSRRIYMNRAGSLGSGWQVKRVERGTILFWRGEEARGGGSIRGVSLQSQAALPLSLAARLDP
jgi:hypothetical protein